jgi:glycine/D-amino acid oxidase-like deaminating enzyme
MKLKSGCIFWPQIYEGSEPTAPPLQRDIGCEVAIIGGGITGALAAYHLTRHGIHTVLVDHRPIGHGSTAASTGLLLYEIDTHLIDLARYLGRDRAVAAYQRSFDALMGFGPLIDELGDRCGLVARPSVYLASSPSDVPVLQSEAEARQSMNLDVRYLERDALKHEFNVDRPAAIHSRHAFEIDPFRLTMRLMQRALDNGLELFGETEITGYEPLPERAVLHAAGGPRITARKVVVATGYELPIKLPPDLCTLSSTYALVSDPVESFSTWPGRALIWEASRPYLYMRTTEDDRVIVGGGDEPIVDPRLRDALLPDKASALCEKFSQLFPALALQSDCAWAGTFAQTRDGLPYVGTLDAFPHCYFALGYGGNGITFSLLAAWIIRDLFLGKESADAHLFGFTR